MGYLMAVSGSGSVLGALGLLSVPRHLRFRFMTGAVIVVGLALCSMSRSDGFLFSAISMGVAGDRPLCEFRIGQHDCAGARPRSIARPNLRHLWPELLRPHAGGKSSYAGLRRSCRFARLPGHLRRHLWNFGGHSPRRRRSHGLREDAVRRGRRRNGARPCASCLSMRFQSCVIPSRAEGEGPPSRSRITQTRRRDVRKCSLRGSRKRFWVRFSATERSLAVCAARDDSLGTLTRMAVTQ